MAISEQLQNRIANLTGDMIGQSPGAISNKEMEIYNQATGGMKSEQLQNQIANFTSDMIGQPKGAISNKEMEIYNQATGGMNPMDMIGQSPGAISNKEMQLMEEMQGMSEEDQESLQNLLEQGQIKTDAPLGEIAEELKAAGTGEDTQLAHLRPGEMVIPPEFLEDAQFESMLEKKYNEFNINPEQAVVGAGIASLNATTGLEEFGFFKKIGKSLKKVAKKVAPVIGPLANFIPGVGPLVAGAIGAATNVVGGGGLKGAIGGFMGGYGTGKMLGGIGGLGKVGGNAVGSGNFGGLGFGDKLGALKSGLGSGNLASTFFNPGQDATGMFGGKIGPGIRQGLGSLTGIGQPQVGPGTYDTGDVIGTLNGQPVTRADLANMNVDQISQMQMTQAGANDKTLMQKLSAMFLPQGVEDALGTGPGGGGFFSGSNQDGGGMGGILGLMGAAGIAGKLGKMAYDETKNMQGVPLTPLTSMDASGRYNIEAEIARRTGQSAPNPVEFGLLPQGTMPTLSGGQPQQQPQGMNDGGSVYPNAGLESLAKVAPEVVNRMGYNMGGYVMPMAYATGGNVAVEDFDRKNGFIEGPGTETSDDVPAMLSDGEFVMTGAAVRGAGSYDMKNNEGIVTLTPSGEEDRKKGTDLMYEMMGLFESYGT